LTGELRRRAVAKDADAYEGSRHFLENSLDPSLRSATSSVHPSLMGGEYLPPLLQNEAEIARVVLDSTTMDVTSIRARRTKHRIVYRIVDEYMEQGADRFRLRPKTSGRPLTMGNLITIIDENEFVTKPRDENFEFNNDVEWASKFATVDSVFYSQLAQWYQMENEEWRREREAEKETEELENDQMVLEHQRGAKVRARTLGPWREMIDAFIADWLSKTPGPSSTNTQMGHNMRLGALQRYIEKHCLDFGSFPKGIQEIEWNDGRNTMTIEFPKTHSDMP